MSFPTYKDYVDSAINWLPKQPSKWLAKPVKAIATINDDTLSEAVDPELEIEYVDIGSVSLENGIEKTEAISFGESPSRARRLPRDGDVLVSTVRTYLKAIAPVVSQASNLVCSTGFAVIRPKPELEPGFLKYALQEEHFIQEVISRSTGVSYPAINASDIGRIKICLPCRGEQLTIASFLDRETAKIDTLIAEQERLIELLQEKRQAVVSHAVTKGLNPDAPMKDSGVEWLGEVPEHWEIKKASWLFRAEKGKKAQELTQEYCADNEGPFPVFSGQTKDEGVMGTIDTYEFDVGEEGAILCTTVGAKAMSIKHIKHKFSLSQNCMTISPKTPEATSTFFQYGFQPLFKFERELIPDHMQPSFRMDDFNQFWVQVPPLEEQKEISKYLYEINQEGSLLEEEISGAIELLQERRSALISAAVTGQIDVRGVVPQEEAA